ncbi:flagellar biogenesis protein [Lysinibacillus sp. 2017]|uniref:flagellar biosynthetic protein FliO n=1 Tax=unclassified Lysinibacillus TaxID=2636778 RepID=UPI000D5290CE|nr:MULTISPECIES: flagellar biosynthetic protein FliO [unclassified Lysinibacillus]AWE06687.1 flagellar biogenesis protein [Lysinibacillus sp. 2017]TGN37381.1 flagellar biogenesis protein [Lysinibacillus sp. S2017]
MQAKKSFRFWLVVGIVWMSILFAPISNGTFASNNTFIGDCIESPDQCEDTNTSDDDTESSESSSVSMGPWEYIKILLALVFVIGLLLFVLKFLNKRNIKYQQNSVIKNVGGMSVGPQKSVQLLLIGNKIYVVGVGEDVHLLKEIDAQQDVEQLVKQIESNQSTAMTTPYIAELFKKFNKKDQPKDISDNTKFNDMFNEKIGQLKQERSDEIERWKEQERDKE